MIRLAQSTFITTTNQAGRFYLTVPSSVANSGNVLVECRGYYPHIIKLHSAGTSASLFHDWINDVSCYLTPIAPFTFTNPPSWCAHIWSFYYANWYRHRLLGRSSLVGATCAIMAFLLGFYIDRGYPLPTEYGEYYREVVQASGWIPTSHTPIQFANIHKHYLSGAVYQLPTGTLVAPKNGVVIDAGATLKIRAGTDLRFPASAGFIVRGTLIVEGEKWSPVRFGPEAPGIRWKNIAFWGEEASHSVMKYCVLTGGGGRRCKKNDKTDRYLPDEDGTIVTGGESGYRQRIGDGRLRDQ